MPATTRTLYALRTSTGRLAILALTPDDDPWLEGVRYVREYLARDEYLAAIAPATARDVAVVRATGGNVPEGQAASSS